MKHFDSETYVRVWFMLSLLLITSVLSVTRSGILLFSRHSISVSQANTASLHSLLLEHPSISRLTRAAFLGNAASGSAEVRGGGALSESRC